MSHRRSKVFQGFAAGALSLSLVGATVAADPKPADKKNAEKKVEDKRPAAKADPSGAWTWSMPGRDGNAFEVKASLKLEDGDKLSGTVSGRRGDNPITDGKYKEGTVSFKIEREREGTKFVSQYDGKLEGDVIKGTMKTNFGGQERSVPWQAKRAK